MTSVIVTGEHFTWWSYARFHNKQLRHYIESKGAQVWYEHMNKVLRVDFNDSNDAIEFKLKFL